MCYTSGTTGNPKGVVYSHRSAYLHSMAIWSGTVASLDCYSRVLPIVPQFHANAWGLVYAALMSGASLCMPDRWLQAEPLCRFMNESQADDVRRRADGVERRARLPRQAPREEARVARR